MIGKIIGPYRVEAQLGAGGMGVVYRAHDTRLERDVALKFLSSGSATDPAAHARLLEEARTASALNHANICTIYDVGEADGQTYMAMEIVSGKPLSQQIPEGGMALEAVLRIGTQVAAALAHAHERNIVHRDLKSANVVITPEGQAKVLDFGLATRQSAQQLTELTRSQKSLEATQGLGGTLSYIAPELLRGDSATTRSDIWAFGVTLHEMASGELPFAGKTGFEISSGILQNPPSPLPARIPPGLRAIIQRCLSKEPAQRYQRGSEVFAALEAIRSSTDLQVHAEPAARSVHAPASGKRILPRWVLSIAVLSLVAVLVLVAWKGFFSRDNRGQNPLPTGRTVSTGGPASANSEANEYFEKGMFFLSSQTDVARAEQLFAKALQIDPKFAEARAWHGFTHLLQLDIGISNDRMWLYKAEEEIRQAIALDPNLARGHSAMAAIQLYRGRKDLTLAEAARALEINPKDFDAKLWTVQVECMMEKYESAKSKARAMVEQDPLLAPAQVNYASVLFFQGDPTGARRVFEKTMDQAPQLNYALYYIAVTYIFQNNQPEARKTLERLKPEDRRNFQGRLMWAMLLAAEGKHAAALKEMDPEVLKWAGIVVYSTFQVAEVYAILGDKEKALEWLEKAVQNGDERAEYFQRDTLLANIHKEPRFKQIIESIQFQKQQQQKKPS